MTKRDRVINAIKHRETDFIPYNIEFTQPEYEKIANYMNDPEFAEKLGNHISSAFYDGYVEETAPGSGYWRDRFGVVWNRTIDKDIGVVDGCIIREPDMNGFKFPGIDEMALRKNMEALTSASNDTFRVADVGFTLYERAWTLRGIENVLSDMITEPDFTGELFDAITGYELNLIEKILEYDVDGFLFGDDWGQQQGLIMGPTCWRKYLKPRMKVLFERVKRAGKVVMLHSCGDISEILSDLIDIGLDVYQTLQPEVYNIRMIKKEYGSDLSFWGGISTQRLLPFASPGEIKRVAAETMDILGKNGGYIAAPTHALPSDIPAENVAALIEVFTNQKI